MDVIGRQDIAPRLADDRVAFGYGAALAACRAGNPLRLACQAHPTHTAPYPGAGLRRVPAPTANSVAEGPASAWW